MPVLDPVLRKDREMKKLTVEQLAFVDAYQHSVADAPREEVLRFVTADSDVRSSRDFYSSMEYYTSIADAYEMWCCALTHARKNKSMTVGKLSAALANLPQDLPIVIWDAGTRLGLAHVDDSFIEDDYPRVELNTDRDD